MQKSEKKIKKTRTQKMPSQNVSPAVLRARKAKAARTRQARAYGRNRRLFTPNVRLPRSLGLAKAGFPPQLEMKLRYVESFTLNVTGGTLTSRQFRANGMYDPTVAVGGHQPMYFDQMMAIYNHWVVMGLKCTFHIAPQLVSGGTNPGLEYATRVVGYLNDDSTITPTTYDMLLEQHGAEGKFYSIGANDSKQIDLFYSARAAFGDPIGNSDLRGNATADPTEQQIFTLVAYSEPTLNVALSVTCVIEYVAVFQELKDLTGS